MNGSKSKQSKQQSPSASEGDDSDYDAIGFSAVHFPSSFRGNNMMLSLFCFFISLLPSFLFYGGLASATMSSWFIMDPSFDQAALEPLAYLNAIILGFILLLLYLQIGCSYVLPFRWTAKAFRSTHSIRVGWVVDSGCTKHVVNDSSA